MNNSLEKNIKSLKSAFSEAIGRSPDLEDKLNVLRIFKNEQVKKIQQEDVSGLSPLPQTFLKLSYLADAVVQTALELASEELSKSYGYPAYLDNDGNLMRSEFAVVGMGKLGGQEIHYTSDLDVIFLYSRNGNTEGRKKIPNTEYYVRLAQKLISFLTVYTPFGMAYKIDTQLRPSGNQGALVSSLDAFADYQRNKAQIWEKQALLKARFVAGDASFGKILEKQFRQFVFCQDFPLTLSQEIHHLRLRMEHEIARETSRRLHYKHGPGGLTDIEFTVQYLQLKMGKIFEAILIPNTYQAIEKMGELSLLKTEEYLLLKSAWLFYRRLETRMELFFDLKGGYLDPQSNLLENLSEKMNYTSGQALLDEFERIRQEVRKVYGRILRLES